jgi:hypothetical protein
MYGARREEKIANVVTRFFYIETCACLFWTGGRMQDSMGQSGTIVFEGSL